MGEAAVVEGSGAVKRVDPPVIEGSGAVKRVDPPVIEGSGAVKRLDPPVIEGSGAVKRLDPPVIEAEGLVKRFGSFTAVDGIDVRVERGEAFGFLGPNGAGKSSTMRMIGAVSPPTAGHLRVLGQDPATHGPAIRARIGVVPQEDMLDTELSVADNLLIYGRYFGLPVRELRPRIAQLLDFMQLAERAGDRVDPLSGGMKRRLVIARALLNDPDLLLLDEPTTGLDPQARHLVWDRLYQLKQRGVTLVLTTHYMDEAEQLCDRLVVMDAGRIVAEGAPLELVAAHATREVLELRFSPERKAEAEARLQDLDGLAERVEHLPDRVLLYTTDADRTAAGLAALGVHAEQTMVRRSSLEDVFLRLTGRSLVE